MTRYAFGFIYPRNLGVAGNGIGNGCCGAVAIGVGAVAGYIFMGKTSVALGGLAGMAVITADSSARWCCLVGMITVL